MGVLADYIRDEQQKEILSHQAKLAAYQSVVHDDKADPAGREYALDQLLGMGGMKGKQHQGIGGIFKKLLGIHGGEKPGQQQGVPQAQGASAQGQQGPPQLPQLPPSGGVPMDVARPTTPGAQPQAQGAPDLVSGMPRQRLSINPPASPNPTLQYAAEEAPQGPPQLAQLPQQVTRMTPSRAFRPVPPVPGAKPDAGGGQPVPSAQRAATAEAQASGRPRMFPSMQAQDERALQFYKSQQDILRDNKIAEEKAKEESGGMKSNAQRVVFKSGDGTLIRALQDMRHPGVYYNPSTGGPMAGPPPGTEVLTESELDRDDAAVVRKQEYDEKLQAKKEAAQQEAADIDSVVESIVKGNQPPDMSRMYGKSIKVKAALAKKYPDFDLAKAELDWRAMQRHVSTLEGPQMVKLRGATNFAVEGLDTLDAPRPPDWKKGDPDPKENDLIGRAAKTAAGSKFKRLNRAYLDAAKNGVFGQEAASDATLLDSQIAEIQEELAVVYKGGNSPTDLGLKKSGDMLKAEWSEQVLRDAIDLSRTNLRLRLNSIKHTLPESVAGGANPYGPKPGASPFAPPPPMPPAGGAAPTGGAVAGAGGGGGAAAGGKIAVISPEGVPGLIDAAKWDAAEKRGFKRQ